MTTAKPTLEPSPFRQPIMVALASLIAGIQGTLTLLLAPQLDSSVPYPFHLLARHSLYSTSDLVMLLLTLSLVVLEVAPPGEFRLRLRALALVTLLAALMVHRLWFLPDLGKRLASGRITHPITGIDDGFERMMVTGSVLEGLILATTILTAASLLRASARPPRHP